MYFNMYLMCILICKLCWYIIVIQNYFVISTLNIVVFKRNDGLLIRFASECDCIKCLKYNLLEFPLNITLRCKSVQRIYREYTE